MSVDFRAGLIYGWKITKGEYDSLPCDIRDEYGLCADAYVSNGDYFVGEHIFNVDCGTGEPVDLNDLCLSFETSIKLMSAIPDIICRQPTPSLFLYCSIS